MTSSGHVSSGHNAEDRDQPVSPAPAPAGEDRFKSAVGRNAEYYLGRWREMRAKGNRYSWNWAACLANLYWFAWRKMWPPMAGLLVAFLLLGVIGTIYPIVAQLTFLISIGITFVTGAFGNHLYRQHCERLVAATAGMNRETAIERLAARGGTSNVALIGLIGATLFLVALSVAGQMAQIQREAAEREAQASVGAPR